MVLSKPQTAVPDELMQPLEPMRSMEQEPAGNMWEIYQHNIEHCSVCYIRYKALIEAVKARDERD